jgi:3-hydroxybutyrate dehydrogenase
MTLTGKSAIVTGSTQGIGLATARALAAQGCNIMLSGLGDPAAIDRLRGEIETAHRVKVLYHDADLSREIDVDNLATTALDEFGTIDILVNNAVVRSFSPVETFPRDRWQMALAVNLTAPFILIQRTLPGMRAKGWGRIVNLSSGFGMIGAEDRIDYITTKTALIGMARAIALETVGTGITVNAICPGAVFTPRQEGKLTDLAAKGVARDDAIAQIMKTMAIERFIPPEGIADVIAFLCTDAAKYISGVALSVDDAFLAGAMMRDKVR